jgi:hypothetical protein
MTQTGAPYGDYESLHWVLNSIAQWIVKYRNARSVSEQLSNCTADEVAAMARDLKISPGELVSLTKKGPDAANLLQKLLIGLGVDPGGLAHDDPLVMRDLQRLCITCGYKRQCEFDLANDKLTENFREYCPNAYTLDALLKAKQ